MQLKSLKIFCDIVGRRSFSRAADENGITQSGASQIVHQLETRLGVKLLDRSKRPFDLTPEGKLYYDGCRDLVKKLSSLEEGVRALHEKVEGHVSVASIYSVGLSYMKQFILDFQERYPLASVHIEYHHPADIYERIKSGEVDIGLLSYPRSSRSLNIIEWREEPMVMVCSPDHPLASRSTITLKQLDQQEMVAFSHGLAIRRILDKLLSSHGLEIPVAVEFDNIEMLKRAIEINSGISLLPEPTILRERNAGTLHTASISDFTLVRPLAIIHRRSGQLGRTASRFVDMLLEDAAATNGKTAGPNGHRRAKPGMKNRTGNRK
ncbi:MAG: LysR family transcriptional regulator [Pirellulaceae bacterium]